MLSAILLLASIGAAETTRYSFNDNSGDVEFDMSSSLHDVDGAAENFSGEIHLGEARPTGSVVLQAAGLTTNLSVRDSRMHTFCLDVERYPTISFNIGAITGDVEGLNSKEGSGNILLQGQLTIRSSTRDISIPASYSWHEHQLRLSGAYQINWKDYGVPDPSIVISKLDPELNFRFDVYLQPGP